MYRIYSVKINGRTLESRNVRELLSRAVSAKRNPDHKITPRTPSYEEISTAGTGDPCLNPGIAVVH